MVRRIIKTWLHLVVSVKTLIGKMCLGTGILMMQSMRVPHRSWQLSVQPPSAPRLLLELLAPPPWEVPQPQETVPPQRRARTW